MTFRTRGLFLLVAIVLVAVTHAAVPAAQSAAPQPAAQPQDVEPPAWPTEFPAVDRLLWTPQRITLAARWRARQTAPQPGTPEAIERQVVSESGAVRVAALRTLVERHPARLAAVVDALPANWYREQDDPVRGRAPLQELIADIKKAATARPREEAARIRYRLLLADHFLDGKPVTEIPSHFEPFLEEFGDTAVAPLAEIDWIEFRDRDGRARLEPLERIARAHPGSLIGAKAQYSRGFALANTMHRAGTDPLDRFLQVRDIVRDLTSGSYPPSEWTQKAPDLVTQFQNFRPAYAPGTVDRMIEGYRAFAAEHLARSQGGQADDAITFLVGRRLGDLFQERGEGLAQVEQVFADLERVDAARARYLKAEFYITRMRDVPAERSALFEKTRDTLSAVRAEGGSGRYARLALAALATVYYIEGDFANARARYREYLDSYPQSEYAWVAALRLARTEEYLGDTAAARRLYRAAIARFPDLPVARILGAAYAAKASEAMGQFDEALRDYQQALDDPEPWNRYSLQDLRVRTSLADRTPDPSEVLKQAVAARVSELKSEVQPGGDLVSKGRWLLEQARPAEALAAFDEAAARFPSSPLAGEARYLARRARIDMGLALGNADGPTVDRAGAIREFDRAAEGPYDFAVTAARIARATITWTGGAQREADALMSEAMKEWQAQQVRGARRPLDPVERDVESIRAFLFTPTGSRAFDGLPLNSFRFPPAPPPYMLVPADISVKLRNAEARRRTVLQTFPNLENVIFVTGDQVEMLDRIITTLGGTRTRRPTDVMQIPNQPVGPALGVLDLWNRYFPARPGHWRGWDLLTNPLIGSVVFVDDDRTQAMVAVTLGYGGGTLLLTKQNGAWSVTRVVSQWVM